MKVILFTTMLFASLAAGCFAAQPAAPPEMPTTAVQMTQTDVNLAAVAMSNAGAACDAGVKIYCQVVVYREGTMAKLSEAAKALTATPAKK